MGDDDASVMLLTCADGRPGRADVDPLLAGPVRRIVVSGTDADLAAVLVRLLRRDRLDVELAYVSTDPRSVAARLWRLPHGPAAADLARNGVARPTPLVRDDAGGVLVGRGEVRGNAGPLHGEGYCDGLLVWRGSVRRLVVTPWRDAAATTRPVVAPGPNHMDPYGSEYGRPGPEHDGPGPKHGGPASEQGGPGPEHGGPARTRPGLLEPAPPGVAVRASRWGGLPDGRLRPVPPTARTGRGAAVGRAVQVGCLPATVTYDGVEHPRAVTRWAWYRHVTDWLLVRP